MKLEYSGDQISKLKAHYQSHGWAKVDHLLSDFALQRLSGWVNELSPLTSPRAAQRLHYYEQTEHGPAICRTERYLDDHDALRALITKGGIPSTAAELLGEAVVIYKEKVNYKHPGGGGFAAHQDGRAYDANNLFITCLVAVDSMTAENGCLEFAGGIYTKLLPDNGDGCLHDDVSEVCHWQPVLLEPGEVVFFSSLVPHRSGPNSSDCSRRTLYLTYNGISSGDRRVEYYRARDVAMRDASTTSAARISNVGHFLGKPVEESI